MLWMKLDLFLLSSKNFINLIQNFILNSDNY